MTVAITVVGIVIAHVLGLTFLFGVLAGIDRIAKFLADRAARRGDPVPRRVPRRRHRGRCRCGKQPPRAS